MVTIVYVPTERLIVSPNPVPEQDYRPIMDSISQFGLQYPLLVVKSDDNYYHIVDGRTRYKALKHLNWKEVPCIVVSNPEVVSLLVEVYRRHVDPKALENLKKSMIDNIYKEAEEKLKILKGILPVESAEQLEKQLNTDTIRSWREICKLYEHIISFDTKTLQNYLLSNSQLAKEKDMNARKAFELEKKLQEKTQKLEQVMADKKRLKEELEDLKKTMKDNFEALVSKKAQEIALASNIESMEKYDEIRKKVYEEIEEQYKQKMQEIAEQLNDRNRVIKTLIQEKEEIRAEKENANRSIKDLTQFIRKIESDYRAKENIIRKALSPVGVIDKIGRAENELISVHKEIISTIDYINLLSESSLTRMEISASKALENLKKSYADVGKSINDLEKTVKACFEESRKEKKNMTTLHGNYDTEDEFNFEGIEKAQR